MHLPDELHTDYTHYEQTVNLLSRIMLILYRLTLQLQAVSDNEYKKYQDWDEKKQLENKKCSSVQTDRENRCFLHSAVI